MKVSLGYDDVTNKLSVGMSVTSFDGKPIWEDVATKLDDKKLSQTFFNNASFIPTGLMPPAVRYLSSDRRTVVWERPPGYRTIQFTPKYQGDLNPDDQSRYVYRIPVPWQIYIAYLSSAGNLARLFMFLRPDVLKSLDADPLFLFPFYNFYSTGQLCQAVTVSETIGKSTVAKAMHDAYIMVWSTGFNKDLTTAYANLATLSADQNPLVSYQGHDGALLQFWSQASLYDVVQWHWPASYTSIIDFLVSGILTKEFDTATHQFGVDILSSAQDALLA